MPRMFHFRRQSALDILRCPVFFVGGVILSVIKLYLGFLAGYSYFDMVGTTFDAMEDASVIRNLLLL